MESRARPTFDDMRLGTGGAAGYAEDSFIDANRRFGDWTVERVRVGRQALGGGIGGVGNLPQNRAVSGAMSLFGLKTAPASKNTVFHAYTELLLRDPASGARQLIEIAKGPRIHASVDRLGGLAPGNEARDVKIVDGISFGQYSAGAYRAHAAAHSGNVNAANRYSIVNANCQDFTIAGLEGSGLLQSGKSDIRDFVQDDISKQTPPWLARFMDARVEGKNPWLAAVGVSL